MKNITPFLWFDNQAEEELQKAYAGDTKPKSKRSRVLAKSR